jgi:hypothetical protein
MNTIKTLLMAAVLAVAALPALAEDDNAAGGHSMKHGNWGIEKLDTDKDGNISKAEFMADAEKHFDNLDANHDGMVSKDEIEARRAARQEKMKEKKEGMKAPAPAEGNPTGGTAEPPKQ